MDASTGIATVSPPSNANDPFGIRDGLVSETDLVGLRKRRKGKAIGKYQSRQNDVCLLSSKYVPMSHRTYFLHLAHFYTAQAN